MKGESQRVGTAHQPNALKKKLNRVITDVGWDQTAKRAPAHHPPLRQTRALAGMNCLPENTMPQPPASRIEALPRMVKEGKVTGEDRDRWAKADAQRPREIKKPQYRGIGLPFTVRVPPGGVVSGAAFMAWRRAPARAATSGWYPFCSDRS